MDLKNLKNIDINDLKNIDVAELRQRIQSRPDIIISIAVVILSIFATVFIYKKYDTNIKNLHSQIKKAKDKIKAADDYKKVQEEYNELLATFPEKIDKDKLDDTISQIAILNNIQIINFTPKTTQSNDYYNYYSIIATISAGSYEDIIAFIKEIEEAPYPFRMESWNGSQNTENPSSRKGRKVSATNEPTEEKLSVTITIGLLDLKS